MKIIAKDNYDRENESDKLIAENIKSKHIGYEICDLLNDTKKYPEYIFVLESDDYKLYDGNSIYE